MSSNLDIRQSNKNGLRFVVVGEQMFRLEAEGSPAHRAGSVLTGRQLGFALQGVHGRPLQAYAQACQKLGITPYYSWQGIINSLGDHNSASPPWRGCEIKFAEGYTPIS